MTERSDRSRERANRTPRLDQPRELRRSLTPRREFDPEAFGRFAEAAARFLGTARFIFWMTVFIAVWLIWNANIGPDRPQVDPYPFIFLTLLLSLQASYAAPLILLAQNRQEARDRIAAEQDRDAAARAHADMEFLTREVAGLRLALGEVATRDYLRGELRNLLAELGPPETAPDGAAETAAADPANSASADSD